MYREYGLEQKLALHLFWLKINNSTFITTRAVAYRCFNTVANMMNVCQNHPMEVTQKFLFSMLTV